MATSIKAQMQLSDRQRDVLAALDRIGGEATQDRLAMYGVRVGEATLRALAWKGYVTQVRRPTWRNQQSLWAISLKAKRELERLNNGQSRKSG